MSLAERVSIAAVIVIIDVAIFFLPLAAFLAAYILWMRPPWFPGLVEKVYKEG